MALYPSDDARWIKIARFVNVLDDGDNKLSPTKINLWSSTLATFGTVFGAVVAWLTGHLPMLQHVLDFAPVVGGYLGYSGLAHHQDKRERNLQQVRMRDGH